MSDVRTRENAIAYVSCASDSGRLGACPSRDVLGVDRALLERCCGSIVPDYVKRPMK